MIKRFKRVWRAIGYDYVAEIDSHHNRVADLFQVLDKAERKSQKLEKTIIEKNNEITFLNERIEDKQNIIHRLQNEIMRVPTESGKITFDVVMPPVEVTTDKIK